MELFLDNDIVLKLSSAGLLQEIEQIFNCTPDSIFILPSAFDYISKSNNVKRNYSQGTINNSLAIIKKYKKIPDDYTDDNKYIRLFDIDDIDSGEQLLYSLTPKTSKFLILTGDKRSITQLNNSPEINDICNYLSSKIVCLEYIILQLLDMYPFDEISKKIITSDYCKDMAIRISFMQNELTIEKAREGLQSYYNYLKKHSGNLLF